MKEKKPVSRIDSRKARGWFARVYRDDWVRGKMFSDGVYGGRSEAERTAWAWQKRVDARLPKIPHKPVLKVAKYWLRKYGGDRYYDVYLPMPGRGKPQTPKLYCNDIREMEKQAEEACRLVRARNARLVDAHRLAYAAWKRERDRRMAKIVGMWPAIKAMSVGGVPK